MSNLFVLMFLVMVIFSLLGMQLFGGCFNPSTGYYNLNYDTDVVHPDMRQNLTELLAENPLLEPQPRFHFDYFVPSMLTVFNLMTGSFYSPMTEHMHAAGWGVASGGRRGRSNPNARARRLPLPLPAALPSHVARLSALQPLAPPTRSSAPPVAPLSSPQRRCACASS